MESELSGRNFDLSSFKFSINCVFQNPTQQATISFISSTFILCLRLTNLLGLGCQIPARSHSVRNNIRTIAGSGDLTTQRPSTLLSTRPSVGPELGSERGGPRSWREAMLFLQASGKRGGTTPRGPRGEDPARKERKCGYLDAPVPKEKPPPVPVPPAATVVEPSVPVPKEKPVDMTARGSAPSASGKESGTLFSPQSRGGPHSIVLAQPGPARRETQSPAAAKMRPGWAEQPLMSTFRRWARARSPPEARPLCREPWDAGWGRRVAQSTLGEGGVGALLTPFRGRLTDFYTNGTISLLISLYADVISTLWLSNLNCCLYPCLLPKTMRRISEVKGSC